MTFQIKHLILLIVFFAVLLAMSRYINVAVNSHRRKLEIERSLVALQPISATGVPDIPRPVEQQNHGKDVVESYSANVISVVNGDTIKVLKDDEEIYVRLESIDCPEENQPYGNRAKRALSERIMFRTVEIRSTGKDRFGQTLAFVIVGRDTNMSEYMVQNGWAWNCIESSKSSALRFMQDIAKLNELGLWAGKNPIPPWEFRTMNRTK